MKRHLTIFILFLVSLLSNAQSNAVIIEGQIIGYNGKSTIKYSLKDYYGGMYNYTVKPDSMGRFIIQKDIAKTQFFTLIYKNKDYTRHTCRLIVKPGEHYSFISEGLYDPQNNSMEHYTPDIYNIKAQSNDNDLFYRLDKGQMYYNLIDNGTSGYLYNEDWDLRKPNNLLPTLKERIRKQLVIFSRLKEKGEIDNDFYQIAKLNIEYTNAYRLAQTICGALKWEKLAIDDTVINNKLKNIYPKIFEMFPVNKNIPFEHHYCFDRYVDLYLECLEDTKDGHFEPVQRKGVANSAILLNSNEHLSEKAYEVYSQLKAMNYLAGYGEGSIEYARKILDEQHEMNTNTAFFIENSLLPKAESFWELSETKMPPNAIIFDQSDSITSYFQLLDIIGKGPYLIDCWGTWCPPCRYQLQYHDTLMCFLEKHNIKLVSIAFEYSNDPILWKNIIKGFNLGGYQFISNNNFKKDFEKYFGKINKFPTYIILDESGRIVERNALYPSQTDLLFTQLKQKLNL